MGPYRIIRVRLYLIPVRTRVPLKFGPETLTSVTCARVALTLTDNAGHTEEGWGETPLSVQWVWPSSLSYQVRHDVLIEWCGRLARAWAGFGPISHPLQAGYDFQHFVLKGLVGADNFAGKQAPLVATAAGEPPSRLGEPLLSPPWLARLVCNSPYD